MPDPLEVKLPDLQDIYKQSGDVGHSTYDSLDNAIKQAGKLPSVTDIALPAIMDLLRPGGQGSKPFEAAIGRTTSANVSAAQSDMMKRGLTGSDIEASAMGQARAEGSNALAGFYGQNAASLASFIDKIVSGDLATQRANLMALAEAMGQKITSDNDLMMFRQQLEATKSMADKSNKAALWGAGISAFGSIAGGAMKPK